MYKLNLPQFDYKLKKADGKVWIFDGIRKKYILLTPEEWVRQHFVHYLVAEKKYPRSLIKVEGGLVYNQLQKRTDIVVFDRRGRPWMIVECKAPESHVSAATLSQASVYNTTLRAEFICVTNGLLHLCAHISWGDRRTTLLRDTPPFPSADKT
jgi:type I site-specific restriction endonuclease